MYEYVVNHSCSIHDVQISDFPLSFDSKNNLNALPISVMFIHFYLGTFFDSFYFFFGDMSPVVFSFSFFLPTWVRGLILIYSSYILCTLEGKKKGGELKFSIDRSDLFRASVFLPYLRFSHKIFIHSFVFFGLCR